VGARMNQHPGANHEKDGWCVAACNNLWQDYTLSWALQQLIIRSNFFLSNFLKLSTLNFKTLQVNKREEIDFDIPFDISKIIYFIVIHVVFHFIHLQL
jgi:hypothetical protein